MLKIIIMVRKLIRNNNVRINYNLSYQPKSSSMPKSSGKKEKKEKSKKKKPLNKKEESSDDEDRKPKKKEIVHGKKDLESALRNRLFKHKKPNKVKSKK